MEIDGHHSRSLSMMLMPDSSQVQKVNRHAQVVLVIEAIVTQDMQMQCGCLVGVGVSARQEIVWKRWHSMEECDKWGMIDGFY